MPEKRFLLVRLESLGDIVLALPAAVLMQDSLFNETTYRCGASYSPAMLSIAVHQVVDAVERRLRLCS
jgi:hypothetical protein